MKSLKVSNKKTKSPSLKESAQLEDLLLKIGNEILNISRTISESLVDVLNNFKIIPKNLSQTSFKNGFESFENVIQNKLKPNYNPLDKQQLEAINAKERTALTEEELL